MNKKNKSFAMSDNPAVPKEFAKENNESKEKENKEKCKKKSKKC